MDNERLAAILAKMQHQVSVEFSVHTFDTVCSTNQTLWQLIEQGARAGSVVIAERQTSGRGQWGRSWSSAPGGLYLSLTLDLNVPMSQSYQLTLCSAWGIARQLRNHGVPVGIKWPNDIILFGKKLAGILIETKVKQEQVTKAVIGVGINWANCVPETGINLQSFPVQNLSLEMLAAITIIGIASAHELRSQQGMDALLPSYNKLLTSTGRLVSVNGSDGTVVGVTAAGELRVRLGLADANNSANPEILLKPGEVSLGYV